MLENIKKKLNSALKDGIQITENISTQFLRVYSSNLDESADPELGIPPEINVAAGSELLTKYEEAWKGTYEANKANAEVAADITSTIDRIQQRMKARQVNTNDVMSCLAGLPAIESNLKASLDKFDEIEKLGFDAEEKLADLADICVRLDAEEKRIQIDLQNKRKAMAELEELQKKQAAEQKEIIRQEEERLKTLQQERQAAFDEAFQIDMEEYKQTGAVTKIQLRAARLLTLDDVQLDNSENDGDLEDFLND